MAFICNDSHVFNASAIFLRGEMPALDVSDFAERDLLEDAWGDGDDDM